VTVYPLFPQGTPPLPWFLLLEHFFLFYTGPPPAIMESTFLLFCCWKSCGQFPAVVRRQAPGLTLHHASRGLVFVDESPLIQLLFALFFFPSDKLQAAHLRMIRGRM